MRLAIHVHHLTDLYSTLKSRYSHPHLTDKGAEE